MYTTILEEAQDIKVRFHIGRGGRFYNGGHKTYEGVVNSLSDCFGEAFITSEDENGKALPDSEWQLVDGGGNAILSGRDEIESDTGVLDWDGDYDTDIVRRLVDCTEDEYQLIYDAAERGDYVDRDVLSYVCSVFHQLLAIKINVEPSYMEVFTQEGCVRLERAEFSVYTEDEEDDVREQLEYKCFFSESMDQIIDRMKGCEWLCGEEYSL